MSELLKPVEKNMNQPIKVQAGSGNVFADLELENSDELLVKAELARKISGIRLRSLC